MEKAPSPAEVAAEAAATPRRGRPVSLKSRRAALVAAVEVLEERGFAGFTVDEVARRSGVSKATIYKHWTGGFGLAVEAYGDNVTDAVPVITTGDVISDLTDQIVRLAEFYANPHGRVVAQLLAAGTWHDGGSALLRERFFGRRRGDTAALIEQGKADGQLRADLDTELTIDLLFGAIVFACSTGLSSSTENQLSASRRWPCEAWSHSSAQQRGDPHRNLVSAATPFGAHASMLR